MSNTVATWEVALIAKCPHCKHKVDLFDYVNCHHQESLTLGEQDTENSTDLDVVCPNCSDEFVVDTYF